MVCQGGSQWHHGVAATTVRPPKTEEILSSLGRASSGAVRGESMVRRKRDRGTSLLLSAVVAAATASMIGCGGDSSVGYTLPPPPPQGVFVRGTVRAPNGILARSGSLQRLHDAVVGSVYALSGTFVPVGPGHTVRLVLRRPDGTELEYGRTVTNAQGQYELALPPNTTEDTCRFLVVAGPLRAFVTSSVSAVDIDPLSEALVRLVLLTAGPNLCAYGTPDLLNIQRAMNFAPGTVVGNAASDAANDATGKASNDPRVQAALVAPIATPTLVASPATPTATIPPTFTPTTGPSATPTLTFTRLPTNTPTLTRTQTRTPTPAAPTATFTRTATRTPEGPTPTATETLPPTATPTETETPLPTPTATDTETPLPTATATASPTQTTSPTHTATFSPSPSPTPTPTFTPVVTPPQITVGSVEAAAGTVAVVPISLDQRGNATVTLAPLDLRFDPAVLTFERCERAAGVSAGKIVSAATLEAGLLRIVGAGDLVPFPNGPIVECRFRIAAGASGTTAISFVSAILADAGEQEFVAVGTGGTISVTGPPPPQIAIGRVSVAPGNLVSVPISLTSQGRNLVTIAPLEFTYDDTKLLFQRCQRAVGVSSTKEVRTAVPAIGRVRLVLAGDLTVLADGPVVECTFEARSTASGTATIAFVSANVADDTFNDFEAAGADGSVTLVPGLPSLVIGDTIGNPGGRVSIGLELQNAGTPVVTLAPLEVFYDASLTFVECVKDEAVSAGKSISARVVAPGVLRIVLAGDLEPLPNGRIASCTFDVATGASIDAVLSVSRAEFADAGFGEYLGAGASGRVDLE